MKLKNLADAIEIIHILVVIISITAMFLIFLSERLKIFSAFWLAGLWLVQQVYGYCPLTVEENTLRKRSGEKLREKKFVPRCFRKYLGINIPDWPSEVVLFIYFVISLAVLIVYFLL